MMTQNTKNHLLGCLDAMLFMPGADRRFSGTYNDMLASFVILALALPMMLLGSLIAPQPVFETQSQNLISITHSLRFFAALGIFLGFVYYLSAKTDRADRFFRFVTAYNWLMLPSVLLALPVTLMMASGDAVTAHQGMVLSYILMAYTFSFTAYIAACTLRIPIELAAYVAIIGFQIDSSSYEFDDGVGSALS